MKIGDNVVVSGKRLKTFGFEGKIEAINANTVRVAFEGMNPTWIKMSNLKPLNKEPNPVGAQAMKRRLFIFLAVDKDVVKKARAGQDLDDALESAYICCAASVADAIEQEMSTIEEWLDGGEECVLLYDGQGYHEIRRGKVEVKPL